MKTIFNFLEEMMQLSVGEILQKNGIIIIKHADVAHRESTFIIIVCEGSGRCGRRKIPRESR